MTSRLLTKQELKVVVPELAERCRDVVEMTAESVVRRSIKDIALDLDHTENSLTMTFNVVMSVGDIVQILSRHERMKRRVKA